MADTMPLDDRALFCDESADFRYPEAPEENQDTLFRFRTKRGDTDSVYMVAGNLRQKMSVQQTTECFDYYETVWNVGAEEFSYFFLIQKGERTFLYDKWGLKEGEKSKHPFRLLPGFDTPKWAKGAVMYQIFVDRFRNGNPSNDVMTNEYSYLGDHVEKENRWEAYPRTMDVRRFYGGDLEGVKEKISYLKYLGVEVVYLNPIFVSPSNHKYDSQDYDYVDPHFTVIPKDDGALLPSNVEDNVHAELYRRRTTDPVNLEASNEYFAEFVRILHENGIRVILDGVFNHCGSFHRWMDREGFYRDSKDHSIGAYVSENSPYHEYFKFATPAWPNNDTYEGWWNYKTLPKLNYEGSEDLVEYILGIGKKWVSPPYMVDGWRLDVAADLGHSADFNHEFWKCFREEVKKANPKALILAEHYGDPSPWLRGDEWDSIMNYDAFMEPVTWFLTGLEKHSDAINDYFYGNGAWFFETMRRNSAKFQYPSLQVAMNQLSNHDHSRFLTRTNGKIGRLNTRGAEAAEKGLDYSVFRAGVILQMTWTGAPTLYYGDEAGVCGWTDPDSRRTYPWGKEDMELIEFYRSMIQIHSSYSCFTSGSLKDLFAGAHTIAFGRFCFDSQGIVVINNSLEEKELKLPVWEIGLESSETMVRLMISNGSGYNVGRLEDRSEKGIFTLRIPPKTSAVYVSKKSHRIR